ncbi:MAG: aspartate aminotransferase family protein [Chitinophagaceae bacterium]|nr:aspartate aminotransferase family protein [Chitinophagaceae bacterium]
MNTRELFLQHIGQTSPAPMGLEIVKAEGCTLTDKSGKAYIDLVGGISVANTGHRHPKVLDAIREQLDAYLHIMVYGEFVETPQVRYAELLVNNLPASLNSVYFTNSGTEAVEGAMKLAKRVTNRAEILAFNHSYHGSTQGSLSIIGDEYWRNAYRPLLPGVYHANHNEFASLDLITENTACVVAELIQAEAGVKTPSREWIQALRKKCDETGALLIADEIQSGFFRTGSLWAFEQFGIVPDILLLGKALGGGLPLGAFIADKKLMDQLTVNPVLGHITTFGGHPLCCAAGKAAMEVILEEINPESIQSKEKLFRELLVHPKIKSVNSAGLWLAVEFDSFETNKKVIEGCIANGVLTDWFLFAPACLRVSPPLVIREEEIVQACKVIVASCKI